MSTSAVASPSLGQGKPGLIFGGGVMYELTLPYAKSAYDTALVCTKQFLTLGNTNYQCNFTWGTQITEHILTHFSTLRSWPPICAAGVEEIILHFTDGKTDAQRNGDKVQDHTHEVSDWWSCAFYSVPSLFPCTMHRHMKRAYVDKKATQYTWWLCTLTGHSPKGKDKCKKKNRNSKVKSGRRKTWLRGK